jgi:hypothetical protein
MASFMDVNIPIDKYKKPAWSSRHSKLTYLCPFLIQYNSTFIGSYCSGSVLVKSSIHYNTTTHHNITTMHRYSKLSLLALASVASVASARPSAPAQLDTRGNTEACTNGKAIYVTSNTAQNAVVALPIAQNGSLLVANGVSTATGGTGQSGLGSNGAAAGPDSLFSQSAIAIAGNVCALTYGK